jgi:hypothetical protein
MSTIKNITKAIRTFVQDKTMTPEQKAQLAIKNQRAQDFALFKARAYMVRSEQEYQQRLADSLKNVAATYQIENEPAFSSHFDKKKAQEEHFDSFWAEQKRQYDTNKRAAAKSWYAKFAF